MVGSTRQSVNKLLGQFAGDGYLRLERDAIVLAHAPLMGEPMVVGSVVLLGVDAWRTAAALESAARGGTPASVEVFYEIA